MYTTMNIQTVNNKRRISAGRIMGILAFAFCMCSAAAGAQNRDLCADAPEEILSRIAAADKLVAAKKYESAFAALGGDDSEYIIFKKTELLTNCYVESVNHKTFALKDLKKNENLADLRGTPGKYKAIAYDPEDVVRKFAGEKELSPLLHLTLGHYYYDVLLLFSGCWLKSDEDLQRLALEHYTAAVDAGCYDFTYLCEYGEVLAGIGDIEGASKSFAQALSMNPDDSRVWYNYGVTCIRLGKYEEALDAAKKADSLLGKRTKDRSAEDTGFLLAAAYSYNGDSANALKTLKALQKKYKDDPLPAFQAGTIYVESGDDKNAEKAFAEAYRRDPAGDTLGKILQCYVSAGKDDSAVAFCTGQLKSQAGNSYNTALLYYYQTNLYFRAGDMDAAASAMDNTELYLLKADDSEAARQQIAQIRELFGLQKPAQQSQ